MQPVASQNAPAPVVVLPHFVTGGLAWLTGIALVVLFPEALTQHFFNPKLLAITHLFVFGWGVMIIYGALYQFIPVILETKLFSERLALLSYGLLVTGGAILITSFWHFRFDGLMHAAALLILLSVLLFGINIFQTAQRSKVKAIERDFILTSVLWLIVTVILGFTLALNLTKGFLTLSHVEWLKIHAHTGLVGWFLQLVIGVGSRLMPMFLVAHGMNKKKLEAAWYLINGGLLTGLTGVFFQNHWVEVGGVAVVAAGVCFFFSFLVETYQKRGKKELDTGMKQSAISFGLLAVTGLLLIASLIWWKAPEAVAMPLAVAYGVAWLGGFITSLILGQTFKTLPFIIWLKVYRKRIGKGKTPLPRDLYSEKLAVIQLWVYAAGIAILLAGTLLALAPVIRTGAVLLLLAAILYNYNVLKIVLHRPPPMGSTGRKG